MISAGGALRCRDALHCNVDLLRGAMCAIEHPVTVRYNVPRAKGVALQGMAIQKWDTALSQELANVSLMPVRMRGAWA